MCRKCKIVFYIKSIFKKTSLNNLKCLKTAMTLQAGPGSYLRGWGSEAEVAHCCGSVRNSARLRAAGPPGWGGRWPGHRPTARRAAASTASFVHAEVPPMIPEDLSASTYEERLGPARQTRCPIRRWELTSEPPWQHRPRCRSQNTAVNGLTGRPENIHFIF